MEIEPTITNNLITHFWHHPSLNTFVNGYSFSNYRNSRFKICFSSYHNYSFRDRLHISLLTSWLFLIISGRIKVSESQNAKSSTIQKWGTRYNGFIDQLNILSHKWFKNITDLCIFVFKTCLPSVTIHKGNSF